MKDIITRFATEATTATPTTTGINQLPRTVGTDNNLEGNIVGILNGVIAALSFVCVVVIIIGGVTYMTSSGDAGKVKKGKDTILYGVIGLVICVLAFAIVNFVISNVLSTA